MRRYRSGADLRRHLPGCAVCTSLCAVRSGQEAGGDRRSEDEPPNRSGYPSRRATTALSAGGTLPRPCCVPIIAFFPWFVNGFAEKFSDFFCFSLWRLYRMHNAWLGFCASQPRGWFFGGAGGQGGLPFWSPADFAVSESAGGACLFGRLLTLPSVFFLAPIPPTPFPSGEGGESRLFHARGSAPCIPGAEPDGAPEQGSKPRAQRELVPGRRGGGGVGGAQGGLAFLVAC